MKETALTTITTTSGMRATTTTINITAETAANTGMNGTETQGKTDGMMIIPEIQTTATKMTAETDGILKTITEGTAAEMTDGVLIMNAMMTTDQEEETSKAAREVLGVQKTI